MTGDRVVVIALDAASPRLLREWADDGTLPNLRRLMKRGLTGDIKGLDGFYIGSTWPSLYTGVNPGRHGFHYQMQLVPGTYRLRRVAEGEPTRIKPFWHALSNAGRRVAVLDVPLSRLDPGINGLQVVEWGVHDALYGFGAVPPSIEQLIVDRYGPHQVGSACDATRGCAADYDEFTRRLVQSIDAKARLTADVLALEPWDFLIQVFSESHCVGHQCWHLHDPSHPAFDPASVGTEGDPVRRVYQALDAAIGQAAASSQDATLIVMSAHGMTHWYGATFLLRDILIALGAAAPAPAGKGTDERVGVLSSLARRAWRGLPGQARQWLAPLRDSLRGPTPVAQPTLTHDLDPVLSRCFPISNGLGTGGIRLNVAGREPQGLLRPGSEVESMISRLTEDFLSLTDADTGRPLVSRVVRTDECCDGPALDTLPDLVIEWSRERPVGSAALGGGRGASVRVRHPRFDVIEGANGYGRSGEHEPDGFFVAAGPGIAAGALGSTVSVLDFAPTVCSLLGCPFERGDGRLIREMLAGREHLRSQGREGGRQS